MKMSYDIELVCPVSNEVLKLDTVHDMRGGTYILGGTKECSLNITYNYGVFYYEVFGEKGIRKLYGMSGAESIPVLESAIEKLGNDVSEYYWDATEGNAKKPLYQLLAFAKLRPDGIWIGD